MKYFFVFFVWGFLNSMMISPLRNGQCPKHCDCKAADNEEVISCIKGGSSLTITVAPNTYRTEAKSITINCTTFDQFAYEIAAEFNVSGVIYLTYNNCSLPIDGSLSLGYSDLLALRFTAETSNEYGTFGKNHFDGLSSLNELWLYSKNTFNLADDAFHGLSELSALVLQSNQINLKVFGTLSNVDEVRIGRLNGEFNLDGLKNCKKLEHLSFANLEVSRLSKRIFENLPTSVKTMFFYDSKIKTIEPDVFESVGKLQDVIFKDSIIENFPSHFSITSKQFKTFELWGDHESLPDELLSNLPNLGRVTIHCNLKSVPENLFKGSFNLRVLKLTGNQLSDLPANLLANQTQLLNLYLDQNRFDVLPENFIRNLMTSEWSYNIDFSLKSNRIESISENVWKLLLEKGREYDFSNNSIADFSVFNNFVKTLTDSGSDLIFEDNPISCDCEKTKALRKYLKNKQNIYSPAYIKKLVYGPKCTSPANLAGTAVIDVQCADAE